MDVALILSPHADDGVLSAGQLMAGRPDVVVATVFTGHGPDGTALTTYDRDSGFTSAREAMAARRAEDDMAVARLRGRTHHLGFADSQYGPTSTADIAAALSCAIRAHEPTLVMCPLGLAHPDHEQVAEACRMIVREHPAQEWWIAEDMPYRVLQPELVPPALERWAEFNPVLGFAGTGPLREKARAVRCYRSQLWALNMMAVLCPERHWRLWP